jgi:hypothetical protein
LYKITGYLRYKKEMVYSFLQKKEGGISELVELERAIDFLLRLLTSRVVFFIISLPIQVISSKGRRSTARLATCSGKLYFSVLVTLVTRLPTGTSIITSSKLKPKTEKKIAFDH